MHRHLHLRNPSHHLSIPLSGALVLQEASEGCHGVATEVHVLEHAFEFGGEASAAL
jgi:hypothetical protein